MAIAQPAHNVTTETALYNWMHNRKINAPEEENPEHTLFPFP